MKRFIKNRLKVAVAILPLLLTVPAAVQAQFSWATNIPVVVDASTSLIYPIWTTVQTSTLDSGSS